MVEKVSLLQEFPNRGHIPAELNLLGIEDLLELNFKPYRILYQIVEKVVFVHCVLDGRRNIKEILRER